MLLRSHSKTNLLCCSSQTEVAVSWPTTVRGIFFVRAETKKFFENFEVSTWVLLVAQRDFILYTFLDMFQSKENKLPFKRHFIRFTWNNDWRKRPRCCSNWYYDVIEFPALLTSSKPLIALDHLVHISYIIISGQIIIKSVSRWQSDFHHTTVRGKLIKIAWDRVKWFRSQKIN